ncbi:MAG: DnaJ domain-containing protein [Leptolyngbyaceae cyanobacterium bins.59]|nr:DnaJ domain-containing protein [Leptolyngbyaceae cyanobacterium bins.59]
MSQISFSAAWVHQFTDPYAVMGVSVTADDRRLLKRYRTIAKLLHPDSYPSNDQIGKETSSQLFARLVSPAYQNLKQEKSRAETLALLRFQVRRLHRQGQLTMQFETAKRLMKLPLKEAEMLYEEVVERLAETQYTELENFAPFTQELSELNRAFFFVKMGDTVIREKRTGLVASVDAKLPKFSEKSSQEAPPQDSEEPKEDYARRHYDRAQEHMTHQEVSQAVQELRDAIKIDAQKSEYHALLGLAYLKQNLTGMATVYFRQALKLNPHDTLAREYAAKLNLKLDQTNQASQPQSVSAKGGFFRIFGGKK